MSRGRARVPVAILLCATLVSMAGGARADEADDSEKAEVFWAQMLAPYDREVASLIERAQRHATEETSEARARAEALYTEAIALDPHAPRPRWELARLREQAGDHAGCAEQLRLLLEYEPDYRPPHSLRDTPMLVDLKLAECLGAGDRFAEAIDRLRRILARGVTDDARIHGWLAQLEMARGHLDAAAYAIRQARRLRPHRSGYSFVEALVHDRAGRPSKARQMLRAALARDPQLRSIRPPAERLFPAADEHYTLGLAHAITGTRHQAVIHLRRYLAEAPHHQWDERARAHLEAIGDGGLPLELTVRGAASLDEAATREALEAARPALERCVEDTPNTLYRVRLTVMAGGDGRGTSGRVLAEHTFATPSDELEAAIACAEDIVGRIEIPRPRGSATQYATIDVWLIGP